jgi:hypothetical protein
MVLGIINGIFCAALLSIVSNYNPVGVIDHPFIPNLKTRWRIAGADIFDQISLRQHSREALCPSICPMKAEPFVWRSAD